ASSLRQQLDEARQNASRLQAQLDAREACFADEGVARLAQELQNAQERNAVAERVMEGVRARSSMLAQELKNVRAELAQLKGG
ncbi:MAG: hypothetical protein MUF54_02485, partial [Polyangiaceae bacterium]|nr:hypothetical protein [Polyangiaceae bacterium]